MESLVAEMECADPKMRPTIRRVLRRFLRIRKRLGGRKVGSKMVKRSSVNPTTVVLRAVKLVGYRFVDLI